MRFYKQKRFYIPLLTLLILLIIATALLYKPLKLVYWANEVYPKEKQILQEYERNIANPSTFFANYTEFQPKLKDFQELNKQIQTIKRDFIIMDKVGLEIDYLNAIVMLAWKFSYLSKNKKLFFSYPETQTLNQSQMQQYKEILTSTQELKEAISKEQFQFAQAYEDFYQFLSKNTINSSFKIYINNVNRLLLNIFFLLSIYSDNYCPIPYRYTETLLPRIQESYMILKELKPNADVLRHIKQSSYEEFVRELSNFIKGIQEFLSTCKRID
ncbi:hypothetical protein [Helicobacter pullorum]|uniref:hypothetical protein n=1 Tax=Helicobacter pullorum TaxID=35818 RepID=UPI0006CDAD01|nr:hypothetical protein [Helicobacter pullorum]KPH54682.1 hypothetical protein HPU229254_00020 [Helicobacter pullorum]